MSKAQLKTQKYSDYYLPFHQEIIEHSHCKAHVIKEYDVYTQINQKIIEMINELCENNRSYLGYIKINPRAYAEYGFMGRFIDSLSELMSLTIEIERRYYDGKNLDNVAIVFKNCSYIPEWKDPTDFIITRATLSYEQKTTPKTSFE